MMPLKHFFCNCKGLYLRKIFFQMMGWYILSVGTVKIDLARRFLYHAFSSEHKFRKKFNLMGTSLEKKSQIMCMFHWRWKEKEGWYLGKEKSVFVRTYFANLCNNILNNVCVPTLQIGKLYLEELGKITAVERCGDSKPVRSNSKPHSHSTNQVMSGWKMKD